MLTRYFVSGMSVLSDHRVFAHMADGWKEIDELIGQSDVIIQTLPVSDRPDLPFRDSATDFLFQSKSDLFFRISHGSRITIYRGNSVGDRDVTLFLIGSAWGVLCHQRGLLPLHCSAVASGSNAFAFIAPSGGGKSTLAASLCLHGYDHVCDDVAIVDITSDLGASLRAMPKGLKLWREAVDALDLKPTERVTEDQKVEKYYVDLPNTSVDQELNLTAIYTLDFSTETIKPCISRVTGAVLLKSLYTNIYRVEWIDKIADPKNVLSQVRIIAETVPVYQFSRPRALSDLKTTTKYLSDHFELLNSTPEVTGTAVN